MSDYGSEEGMDKLFAKMRQNISAKELICDHADECQKMRSEGGPMSKIKQVALSVVVTVDSDGVHCGPCAFLVDDWCSNMEFLEWCSNGVRCSACIEAERAAMERIGGIEAGVVPVSVEEVEP